MWYAILILLILRKLIVAQTVLETLGISKSFAKIKANQNINIKLYEGEIISILGENGAGKSTLMNILYGLYRPDEGRILLNGAEFEASSPREAITKGLGMVHQHFMLVETLSVTQNIILGEEPRSWFGINYRKAREDIINLSKRYHLKIDPDEIIANLTVGLQQRVEILKALYRKARILILDEPTSVLTPQEIEDFFSIVKNLRDQGTSVIIITHKLEEIRAISDRVYILRKGRITGEFITRDVSVVDLANHMVGRDVILQVNRTNHETLDEICFRIDDLKVMNNRGIPAVDGLSLYVKPGEIVGIAGVDGNGQEELSEAVIGTRRIQDGAIHLRDQSIKHWSIENRIENGIGYVPADRQKDGLILPFSIAENVLLGNQNARSMIRYGHINRSAIRNRATKLISRFSIVAGGPDLPANYLSGGNQQKLILAREFDREPDFLLVSQPTRGLDVGAIEYIHNQLITMRDRNVGILLISMELEEIFSLADRILVIFRGRILKEFEREEATMNDVGFYMTGGTHRNSSNV
ncbi:ABC transporter ATP-binding protein [Olavius algarvensis spirochete endosymbiont]|nr:MAG: ABC transporter, ATP-binding protein (cluster 11, riboflavin/purine nucleoside/unknown) / ABC transporter, ATP-binding protein (cluster 11, riboflavin/purine nucleoside/unknown) [Olavius algarvensis spirochete endosymbiont]VDA99725.1 ABC transporter ATP-binding protein [Olavius algarvensis spirochete endosymbiont]